MSVISTYTIFQFYTLIPAVAFISIFSIFWDIYFIKRIRYFREQHSNSIRLAKQDLFGYMNDKSSLYKIEIVKYSFLLVINIFEFSSMIFYSLGVSISKYLLLKDISMEFPNRLNSSACEGELFQQYSLQLTLYTNIPLSALCITMGQIGMLFSIGMGICLLAYLNESYYRSCNVPRWIKQFIILTSFLSVIIFVLGIVPHFLLAKDIIEPIFLTVYFCVWIKYIRKYRRTLKRQTIDMIILCKSKSQITRSKKTTLQFTVIISLVASAFGCFLLGEIVAQFSDFIYVVIYFGPCIFSYLFRTNSYTPLVTDQKQIDALYLAMKITFYVEMSLIYLASLLNSPQYLMGTVYFFGRSIWRDLMTRCGRGVKIRYSPILNQALLDKE